MAAIFLVSGLGLSAQDAQVNDFVYALSRLIPDEAARNAGLTIFPILSMPFGGDQTAMGSAYTAVARDISFLESNPAAGAIQDETQVAVNTASIIDVANLQTAGWSDRWGNLSLGAFAKILSSDFSAFDIYGTTDAASFYLEMVAGMNGSMTLLRDYNFTGIAIGATVKLAYRSIPKEIYYKIFRVRDIDQSAVDVMADFGAITRFNFLKPYSSRDKNFSVGLAVKNLGPPALGEPLPTTVSAGISWQPLRPWTIAADFNLPVNLVDPTLSMMPGFAVGTSLQIANFAAVKGGFQLKGGDPRFTIGGEFNLIEWTTFTFAYTLDLSSNFKFGDHFSLQAKLNFGDNGRAAAVRKVDDLYIAALVASSNSDWEKVISLCEEALRLDPGFLPAKDVLKQAQASLNLVKQIESIRVENTPTP